MLIRAVLPRLLGRRRGVYLDRCVRADRAVAEIDGPLGQELYEIFCDSYGDLPLEVVRDEITQPPNGVLSLWRDPSGRLVGFTTNGWERLDAGGSEVLVIRAGAYFRRGSSAAWRLRVVNLVLAGRAVLSHFWLPAYAAIEALTPVTYVWLTKVMVWHYPHPDARTPPKLQALASEIIGAHGLAPVPGRPFVAHYSDPASHTRTLSSARILADPAAQHYLHLNPNYRDGHFLLVLVPMTALNVLAGLFPVLGRALRVRRSTPPQRSHDHEPRPRPQ